MKEICIPVPHFGDKDIAEVSLTVGGKKLNYQFRVESFPWDTTQENVSLDEMERSLSRINNLKSAINEYDSGWELIQIYTPVETASYIQVLYRKRHE